MIHWKRSLSIRLGFFEMVWPIILEMLGFRVASSYGRGIRESTYIVSWREPPNPLFGMSQTIVGGSAIKPVLEWGAIRWLNLALLGDINGRFIDIRGKQGQSTPSIETLYTDA